MKQNFIVVGDMHYMMLALDRHSFQLLCFSIGLSQC